MVTFLCVIFLLCEIGMIAYLINKIRKCKKISLKDTAIYPLLMLVGAFVMCTAHAKYCDYSHWFENLTYAFSEVFDIVKLSVDNSLLKTLYEEDVFMLIVYVMLYIVSALALFSLSLSLVKTVLKNALRIKIFNKEITCVFGFNDDAKTYIRNLSGEQRKNTCVVLKQNEINNYSAEKLFLDENSIKYYVLPYGNEEKFKKTVSKLTRRKSRKYNIIYFFDSENQIYDTISWSQNYLKENDLYGKNLQFIVSASGGQTPFIRELIKGNPDGEVINAKGRTVRLQDESRGNITAFDKYEIQAFDFVCKHNFAKYFPSSLLNENCTVRDCDVNLYVLGLGKVNQALIKDILIETQFVTVTDDGRLAPLRMNVVIYDKVKKFANFPLSYGLLKYDPTDYGRQNYFELPEAYSTHVDYRYDTDTGEAKFINRIYDEIKKRGKKKPQVNYFIVSLDSDYENSLIAKRLKDSLSLLDGNFTNTFFVRCRNGLTLPDTDGGLIYFGDEKNILTYDNVVADAVYKSAKIESCIYQGSPVTDENVRKEWCTLSQIKQQSNLYSVASLPFKLSLLRIENGVTEEEYFKRYDPENQRKNYEYSQKLSLPGSFSARDVLAFSEHERWNAFELNTGAMPMKIKNSLKVTADNGQTKAVFSNKSENELYHLCITTQKGLNEYYDYVTKINKEYGLNETADVIKYDYDLMDNVLLHIGHIKR